MKLTPFAPAFLAFTLLVLTAPASASEKIKLRGGEYVVGTATSYDEVAKVLHFQIEGGEAMMYTLDELDQRSVYLVHTSVISKDNGQGQLGLANFARDIGLYAHSARRYEYAEAADPSLAEEIERQRIILRRVAAVECLKRAKDALAENKPHEAEKWLKKLLEKLPNEPQAKEAAALLEARYSKLRAEKEAKVAEQLSEQLQKDVAKGKAKYESMVANTQKGLTARSDSQAKRLWQAALRDADDVLKEIAGIAKKYPGDEEVSEGLAKYTQLTHDQMIELYLHLASQAMIRSSLKEAQKYCNQALSLDSKNKDARAMRARIENAANEPLFGWVRG